MHGKKMELSRRDFVRSIAAAGAGLALSQSAVAQEAAPAGDKIQIAMIGTGSQGRQLMMSALKIDYVRFVSVCDIWPYHQKYAGNILKKFDQPVNVYSDYREMLDKEKGVDAVIVATPDWMHAEHAIACMEAGKHVYCEKEMSNTLEKARQMVLASRKHKKLLQIGHQRRSNPRYMLANKLIHKDKMLGRITHCNGQWNRARRLDVGWPKGKELDAETLKRYGYETMERFRNWRWYRDLSGGPMADLGSHQIDIFTWVLQTDPSSVLASGGTDYYAESEWYDNVMSIYEYKTEQGVVRAFYQVLNTTSYGDFFEVFMGDEGAMVISEDVRKGYLFREQQAKKREWEDEASKVDKLGKQAIELKVGETLTPEGEKDPKAQKLAADCNKPVLQVHLENFFDAIRKNTPLSCPAEEAYRTTVAVLRANEAVAARKAIQFKPEEFKV